ncbi:MAG: RNA-binding transcriptional accessory protein, partial [Clostridia bacterium]|nr:RNA-binding transcriptional accessory protein [Clostridia bacterium]
MDHAKKIAKQFNCKEEYVTNIITLIDGGNTIPFIARYRKEMHGSMDDQLIREIAERLEYLRSLDQRREEVRAQITSQEKMTDEIAKALDKAETLSEIEDIYRPFKPKRKTRASVAKEKGLEPLANLIFLQADKTGDPLTAAAEFISEEKGVATAEDALAGALDIIAETVSDNAEIRKELRRLIWVNGIIVSEASDKEKKSVYTQYYEYSEPVKKIASHRVLAIDRGEKEGFLKVRIDTDRAMLLSYIYSVEVKGDSMYSSAVKNACDDAFDRLIYPSVSREIRNALTEIADEGAIKVFAANLRQLLMQPPVKGKVTMGLDPGYRTGCKVAVVDPTGKVLDTAVIYPTHSEKAVESSRAALKSLIQKHGVQVIAIGNGTASKETEIFTVETLKSINAKVQYMIVSEAGASVYSAS